MQLTQIYIYPVKSCAGIPLQQSDIVASGLKYDRQWMIVDQNNRFLTQRTHPQMSLIETAVVSDQLILSSFGMGEHTVPKVNPDMEKINTEVFGDPVKGIQLDLLTNEWLSQALDTPCKLICFPEDNIRECDQHVSQPGEHTKFADAFPLLVVSQASLNDLNSRLTQPVSMDRFRPNLVVEGCEAFAEDHWNKIRMNDVDIRFLQTCARCSVPTVDQQTGVLAGPEPIHTLSSYRGRGGEIFFGVNMVAEQEGFLKVGDLITVF